jgi:hypothetical protein
VVATTFFPAAHVFGAATGFNYPDALSEGVFMATGGRLGPMLLVEPIAPLPVTIAAYLAALAPGAQGHVFGGPLTSGMTWWQRYKPQSVSAPHRWRGSF